MTFQFLLAGALCVVSASFVCKNAGAQETAPTTWKFNFDAAPRTGFQNVTPQTRYDAERGFGFDGDANPMHPFQSPFPKVFIASK